MCSGQSPPHGALGDVLRLYRPRQNLSGCSRQPVAWVFAPRRIRCETGVPDPLGAAGVAAGMMSSECPPPARHFHEAAERPATPVARRRSAGHAACCPRTTADLSRSDRAGTAQGSHEERIAGGLRSCARLRRRAPCRRAPPDTGRAAARLLRQRRERALPLRPRTQADCADQQRCRHAKDPRSSAVSARRVLQPGEADCITATVARPDPFGAKLLAWGLAWSPSSHAPSRQVRAAQALAEQ